MKQETLFPETEDDDNKPDRSVQRFAWDINGRTHTGYFSDMLNALDRVEVRRGKYMYLQQGEWIDLNVREAE